MARTKAKKVVTKVAISKTKRDTSPNWEGSSEWSIDKFYAHFHTSMLYYRTEYGGKDLKPQVIKWLTSKGADKAVITSFKRTKDWRSHLTMGSIASCLLKGMPEARADFNNGKNTAEWLLAEVNKVIAEGREDVEEATESDVAKPATFQPSIQDRLREVAMSMTDDIETAIENWQMDPETFEPKAFKVLNLLKGKDAKAAHARVIRDFYKGNLEELEELASGNGDEQLREGYSHLSKKNVRKMIDFLNEINSACTMLMQESKVNRKPRAKKVVPADKIVAKLKYKKTDEPLKLVSINPADIIGAKELWIYNTKTRKLGKYVASEYQELSVKGTTITGFSEDNSVQKTLRKPVEQLKEFKSAGKVALRKFLEDIKSVDTKMNGRINEETLLLKVQ
jgi:DNA uptake protein ComE-like DNA-binding protein